MYPQMVYHADVRAREKALAARDREMGCSSCAPLGRMISRFIMKCNGREGRVRYNERMGMDYAMAYAPAQTCYVRPTSARTVTLATTTSHHPTNAQAHHPDHPERPQPSRTQSTTTTSTLPPGTPSFAPAGAPAQRKPRKKKKKHVRFTPAGAPVPAGAGAAPHDTAMATSGGSAAATVYHHHGALADSSSYSPAPPAHGGGGHGGHHGYAYGYGRYAPSPLPRWEMLGTPRRPEYFSSEYRWYYPTPVREGIYSIATDANGRLTTIFSEENPNACTIV